MRIAAVQATPAFLDRSGTIDIVLARLAEAAAEGAEVVAFPETFIPGYPMWHSRTNSSSWEHPDQQAAFAWYLDQAVDLSGPEFGQVVAAVKDAGVFVYVGVAERSASRGSVYCSLVAIDPTQGIVSVHRKLKPTFGERMVWADGDGAGLVSHQHQGVHLSGLNCWENWMPLARSALYAAGTEIHFAAWPGDVSLTQDLTRFMAQEGRIFVVSVGGVYGIDDIPEDFPLRNQLAANGSKYSNGGTCIAGPDGEWIVEPVRGEQIVYADLDVTAVRKARQNFDPAGHYSRPDVLRLEVNRNRLA
jgi:nitrilase